MPGGGAFVRLAEISGINLRFAIVSALGSTPSKGQMLVDIKSYRVLDPFFWSLHLRDLSKRQSSDTVLKDSNVLFHKMQSLEMSSVHMDTPLKVFLCHSSSDKPIVRKLYNQLSAENWIDTWLDEAKLLPGENWDLEIRKAVKSADIVIVCLSNGSINKEGYLQKEIRQALDIAEEKPEGTIFVIPLKLDTCDVPDRLSSWHWVNYFEEGAYSRLLQSLRKRAMTLGIKTK